jgi:hypothetical protein
MAWMYDFSAVLTKNIIISRFHVTGTQLVLYLNKILGQSIKLNYYRVFGIQPRCTDDTLRFLFFFYAYND